MLLPLAPMAMAISSKQAPGERVESFKRRYERNVVILKNAFGDGTPPPATKFHPIFAKPEIVAVFFRINVNLAIQIIFAVAIVAVENAELAVLGGRAFLRS